MKSFAKASVFSFLLLFTLSGQDRDRENMYSERLARAYPDFIVGIKQNKVLWKDGTEMTFDDGKADKDWLTLLRSPDLEDQLRQPYPPDYPAGFRPAKYASPGRIRYLPFFKKMYGATRAEIEANLAIVRWMPSIQSTTVKVTRINGVNKKLAAVSAELEKLPRKYRRFLKNIGGTYAYRTIKDSDRLSMHSFGIAVDLNAGLTEYWKWKYKNETDDVTYRNSLPYAIAQVFERHGFIWGGKWYHYDTMHFEYRPELLGTAHE
jgi:hypothetical protein